VDKGLTLSFPCVCLCRIHEKWNQAISCNAK